MNTAEQQAELRGVSRSLAQLANSMDQSAKERDFRQAGLNVGALRALGPRIDAVVAAMTLPAPAPAPQAQPAVAAQSGSPGNG